MKCLILCVLLAGGAFGFKDVKTIGQKDFITANLNDYIDSIMPNICNFIVENDMDPMPIPDYLLGLSVKPLFITYHGELELTKGTFSNLQSLSRDGDVEVGYLNKLLKVSGDFAMKDVSFTYRYLAKIMDIGPTGGVLGSLNKASVKAEFLIDFTNNEIHLQDFYMHSVGTIKVKLTGNILTDFLANAIIGVVTTLFKGTILGIVESNIKKALEDYLSGINSIGDTPRFLELL